MDYEAVASEFLRALRGRRSQTAFSRRLKYRSNVAYSWESGRGWPTAARMMWVAEQVGIDLREALFRFYRGPLPWPDEQDLTSPEAVVLFLNDLRGRTSILDLARASGCSRFAISRWLKGISEPRLPDFFRMVEAISLRLLDFIEVFVNPASMKTLAQSFKALQATRQAAYDAPWTQAILRVLELKQYHRLAAHESGWIADRLGISREEETRCLELLAKTGQIRWQYRHWALGNILTVDTRRDPESAREAKAWWASVGLERLKAGSDGIFSYNIFAVSRADLERLREIHKAYFRQLRAVVSQSKPAECVALVNLQLLELNDGDKK